MQTAFLQDIDIVVSDETVSENYEKVGQSCWLEFVARIMTN